MIRLQQSVKCWCFIVWAVFRTLDDPTKTPQHKSEVIICKYKM